MDPLKKSTNCTQVIIYQKWKICRLMLWIWAGRKSHLWDFNTSKYDFMIIKCCDINFQACKKITSLSHMYHTYAKLLEIPEMGRSTLWSIFVQYKQKFIWPPKMYLATCHAMVPKIVVCWCRNWFDSPLESVIREIFGHPNRLRS